MIDVKKILLTQDELEKCIRFADESARSQQRIEYGEKTTQERQIKEIARDNLIGKIAETAFSKVLMENYGIYIPLDFNIYPRSQWDQQDAEINGWRIDIKGTRQGGKWMLIEWNKLRFRQNDNELSHVYVMFSVGWERGQDRPTGEVCYEGAASLSRLAHGVPTTSVLRKGSILPGTKTALQADNFGIKFENLNNDFNQLVQVITANKPPKHLTSDFVNPFLNA